MSDRPTDQATNAFMDAAIHLSNYEQQDDHRHLARALRRQSQGLIALSKGLRATYILLEEVKSLLHRQQPSGGVGSMAAGIAAGVRNAVGAPAIIASDPAVQAMIKDAIKNAGK
jgi:hypothetical protein